MERVRTRTALTAAFPTPFVGSKAVRDDHAAGIAADLLVEIVFTLGHVAIRDITIPKARPGH